ncbi:MAG: hypothetical protein MHM6MM_000770 [Cercozoa sp. M6MM]
MEFAASRVLALPRFRVHCVDAAANTVACATDDAVYIRRESATEQTRVLRVKWPNRVIDMSISEETLVLATEREVFALSLRRLLARRDQAKKPVPRGVSIHTCSLPRQPMLPALTQTHQQTDDAATCPGVTHVHTVADGIVTVTHVTSSIILIGTVTGTLIAHDLSTLQEVTFDLGVPILRIVAVTEPVLEPAYAIIECMSAQKALFKWSTGEFAKNPVHLQSARMRLIHVTTDDEYALHDARKNKIFVFRGVKHVQTLQVRPCKAALVTRHLVYLLSSRREVTVLLRDDVAKDHMSHKDEAQRRSGNKRPRVWHVDPHVFEDDESARGVLAFASPRSEDSLLFRTARGVGEITCATEGDIGGFLDRLELMERVPVTMRLKDQLLQPSETLTTVRSMTALCEYLEGEFTSATESLTSVDSELDRELPRRLAADALFCVHTQRLLENRLVHPSRQRSLQERKAALRRLTRPRNATVGALAIARRQDDECLGELEEFTRKNSHFHAVVAVSRLVQEGETEAALYVAHSRGDDELRRKAMQFVSTHFLTLRRTMDDKTLQAMVLCDYAGFLLSSQRLVHFLVGPCPPCEQSQQLLWQLGARQHFSLLQWIVVKMLRSSADPPGLEEFDIVFDLAIHVARHGSPQTQLELLALLALACGYFRFTDQDREDSRVLSALARAFVAAFCEVTRDKESGLAHDGVDTDMGVHVAGVIACFGIHPSVLTGRHFRLHVDGVCRFIGLVPSLDMRRLVSLAQHVPRISIALLERSGDVAGALAMRTSLFSQQRHCLDEALALLPHVKKVRNDVRVQSAALYALLTALSPADCTALARTLFDEANLASEVSFTAETACVSRRAAQSGVFSLTIVRSTWKQVGVA